MNEQLWQRIQASLDAGQDPLDDAFLSQSLHANPDLLEDFAELRSGLRTVSGGRGVLLRSEVRRRLRAAVAVLTFLLLATLVATTDKSTRKHEPRGRIIEFSAELSVEHAGERRYESYVSIRDRDEQRAGIEARLRDVRQEPVHSVQLHQWSSARAYALANIK